MQRHFDRFDAAVDFLLGLFRFDLLQAAVQPCVMPDGMAFGRDPPHQFRMPGRGFSDQKERRAHALSRQGRKDPRRRRRPWAIIEGQHHLMVVERQGLRKVFQSDARRVRRIDRENARGAERARARTLSRVRGCRAGDQGNDGHVQYDHDTYPARETP